MAEKKAAKKATAKKATATEYTGLTEEERAAMKNRTQELKAEARRGKGAKVDEEGALLEKLAEMDEADRVMGERIHEIVKAAAPTLTPKLWYGMPAYAKNGKIIVFYQPAAKFKARYATLGFNDDAKLDDGAMWPTAFALMELTAADEARIAELVKKAAG
ncbi:uncharacterized protein YdhG (YjbR/CyaY superfamily) [Kribbella sp. VKM Ac-2527]|uniref:Uncharacterized protein YdhG (YjbR/CyaY superfamily) n=1 Tax=Kribbella caucasensis TaxID=2512215 RepID=A0A4R6JBY9_9ACTN|nr:DUF1801 domain-containing protein [Kribbella sp. VKM Ac-2527]TDO33280.1 uncharacterized protein YdhG (YjbR/CyaY superfamily) [Kribbella sp. VKM Ac-2527]